MAIDQKDERERFKFGEGSVRLSTLVTIKDEDKIDMVGS